MSASPSPARRGRPANTAARLERRAAILEAAQGCFVRKGFHATSTAEISQAAGISVAGLYQYFPSKDDLIVALVEHELEVNLQLVRQLLEAEDVFAAIADLMQTFAGSKELAAGARLRLEILAEATRNEVVAAALDSSDARLLAAMSRAVARAQERGQIDRGLAPEDVALFLDCLSEGVFAHLCRDTAESPPPVAPALALLSRALAPRS